MKILFLITILSLLSGCTGVIMSAACLDSKIPRETRVEPTIFEIEFINSKRNRNIIKKIQCEEYYDAQCSVRGNSWRWRATEQVLPFITYTDNGAEVKIDYPTCSELVENKNISIDLFDVEFMPSRDSAKYSSRVGETFTFYYYKWMGSGNPGEKTYFDITMQLNVKKYNHKQQNISTKKRAEF